MVGKVVKLFLSHKGVSQRVPKEILTLDEQGVIDDKFYNKNIQRSTLITSLESYALAKNHGIEMSHGQLGENLLIDYNPYALPDGSQLQVGDVVLEITQLCTICNHLSVIDKSLPQLLKEDRGIFAKVIQHGTVKINDKVYLLNR